MLGAAACAWACACPARLLAVVAAVPAAAEAWAPRDLAASVTCAAAWELAAWLARLVVASTAWEASTDAWFATDVAAA